MFAPVIQARTIALLNLVVLVCGSFSMYVQSRTVVPDDAAATAARIVAEEALFRLGIVSLLVMCAVFVFIAWLWYGLLERVSRSHALLMLVLILVSLPIAMLNELHAYEALRLASGPQERHAELLLALDLHTRGGLIAGLFWGLWLFPLGLLVYRSTFLPRALGLLLMLGSPGYVVRFAQGFLFPGAEATLWTNPPLILTHVAELATMLWMLVRGVDADAWQRRGVAG